MDLLFREMSDWGWIERAEREGVRSTRSVGTTLTAVRNLWKERGCGVSERTRERERG